MLMSLASSSCEQVDENEDLSFDVESSDSVVVVVVVVVVVEL